MAIPLKTIFKVVGVLSLGVGSALQAMDTDKKTQEVIKKLAEKSADFIGKKS